MKVLIFSATSDLGLQLAHVHAKQGDQLVLTGRSEATLDRIQKDLAVRYEAQMETHVMDARLFETHEEVLNQIKLDEVDRVYCVFGYLGQQEKALTDFEESRQIVEVNYTGALSLLNRVALVFEKRKSGTLVGISSVAGERGRMSNFIYGSAKAAFTTYLDGLRNHLAHHKVHVMTVKPGFMRTKMTEGLPLPGPLTADAHQAAQKIVRAADKQKNTLYVLPIWRWIMLIIRNIPEFIFKKMKM